MTIEHEPTIWQLLGIALRARDFVKARELLEMVKRKSAERRREVGSA